MLSRSRPISRASVRQRWRRSSGETSLLLGLAGGERRHLAGAGGGLRTGRLEDLLAALGELAQVGVGEALDLGDAVSDRLPLHAEPLAQLMAEVCLIDVAGGLGVVEDRRVVEAGPAPVGALGRVGDQDMGVELGIAGAGGAVLEGGGEEAVAVDEFLAAGAAAGPAGLALQVVEGGCCGVAVGLVDLDRRLVAAECPEQGDGLRGGEGEVEAGDRSLPPDGAHPERLAVGGVAAGQHRGELVCLDPARQAQLLGRVAYPVALRLALAGVVVLGAFGDLVEVVALLAGAELSDRQHRPTCRRSGRVVPLNH